MSFFDRLSQMQPQLDLGVFALAVAVLGVAGVGAAVLFSGRGVGRSELLAHDQGRVQHLRESVARFDAAAYGCRQAKTMLKRAADQDDKAEAARLQGAFAQALRDMKAAETALMLLLDPSQPDHEALEKKIGDVVDATLAPHANSQDDLSSELIETARTVLKRERERLRNPN